jgi:transcription elongation factor Elf1
MSSWVDIKYANLVSSKLERFKIKTYNPYNATFRCPICGDSKKNTLKTRGGFFQKQDAIIFKCFNCGVGRNIGSFLREIDPSLYKEYVMETYTDKDTKKIEEPLFAKKPQYLKSGSPLSKLKKISQLSWDHPAKIYVLNRKIPNTAHTKLFYCSKFASWTNSMIPKKLDLKQDTPRLVIPFIDEHGKIFGYQGRSFDPNDKIRYITIMLQPDKKVFGLDTVDFSKKHYIVEGPIDSLFLPNAIAMGGADINTEVVNSKSVFVYDNEPRNPDIVKRMKKILDSGYNICIWPTSLKYKDINDMILGGISQTQIVDMIDKHTYNGMIGLVKFNEWKKV